MIGNDIVDLGLAEVQSNWRRKGFLKKVFTANERLMIFRSLEPDVLVWKLWSMKESAYKARLRVQKKIKIDPRAFECVVLNKKEGQVYCEGKTYLTLSSTNEDFIHTIAYSGKFEIALYQDIVLMNQTKGSSKVLYEALISEMALRMAWNKDDVVIEKNELGIPELYRLDRKSSILCSLSHHGRYGSYIATC